MKKIIIATLLGSVVMFVWAFVYHVALPTGAMGVNSLPTEEPVLAALRSEIPEAGLYLFPGQMDDDMETLQAKYAEGPTGLLAYRPGGGEMMSAGQLGRQFMIDVVAAALLAVLLLRLGANVRVSLLTGALAGLFATSQVSLPQWNWYGFPIAFVFSQGLELVIGWGLAGAVMGWYVKR